MNKKSLCGGLIALIMIPALLGLMGCLPVPIGDPAKTRIDPHVTGTWYMMDDDDVSIWSFIEYDEHSWLLFAYGVEGLESVSEDFRAKDFPGILEDATIGEGGVHVDKIGLYKAWTKTLADQPFMTMQSFEGNDIFTGRPEPEFYIVMRMDKEEDALKLVMLDPSDTHPKLGKSHDLYDGIKTEGRSFDQVRRSFERVIRKNVDNPVLYLEEDEDTVMNFVRLPEDYEHEVKKLVLTAVSF